MRKSHPVYKIIADHAASTGLTPFAVTRLSRIVGCYEQSIGTHTLRCDSCGTEHIIANTCKSLHCPFCSYIKTQNWIAARINEMLKCKYFHNVFTLPHEFNDLFRHNFKEFSNIFYKSVSETLNTFSDKNEKKNKPGFMLFLHTWDQRLNLHFHIHAVIAGGWLDKNGIWVDATRGTRGNFLFPVKALSKVFRGKFIELFNDAYDKKKLTWNEELSRADFLNYLPKDWNAYSKSTDGSTDKVIQYLGRYTHRTGLSKSKLSYDGEKVIIHYRDRKTNTPLEETLTPSEFLQRFTQHFFKDSTQRVRYYGFMGNASKSKSLALIRDQIGEPETPREYEKPECGHCGGSTFTFVSINWAPAPIIGSKNINKEKRNRDPRGPPSLQPESATARPSFVDSQKFNFDRFGPKPGDYKERHA